MTKEQQSPDHKIEDDKNPLQQNFDAASPASGYDEDMGLEEEYKKAVEIKMDTIYFYIKHKNSGEIVRCSAYTGPRKFKELIEIWVDSIINPSTDSSIA